MTPSKTPTAQARVRCVWCGTELAPEDAKPIKYARLEDVPDAENMQCKDEAACDRRQEVLDRAVGIIRERRGQ